MSEGGYNQFCPVAMASEILCTRWTVVLLRELIAGSTRFNELRRGLPRMSPALMSKRLKELEQAGVVTRVKARGSTDVSEYRLTPAGLELKPLIEAIGVWGHRWIETEASLGNLDPGLLMWDIRRNIDPNPMPPRKSVIQFMFSDLAETRRNYWLVVEPAKPADLCAVDPGFDVDLYVATDVRTMTEVWMGYTTIRKAKASGGLVLTGDRKLESNIESWLKLSTFAKVEKLVA